MKILVERIVQHRLVTGRHVEALNQFFGTRGAKRHTDEDDIVNCIANGGPLFIARDEDAKGIVVGFAMLMRTWLPGGVVNATKHVEVLTPYEGIVDPLLLKQVRETATEHEWKLL